jgi:diguanylate cyclase (GGDEF)-like protein
MPPIRLTRQADVPSITDLAPYEEDLVRALDGNWRSLYFPARLEQLFESETQLARSRHLVTVGICWIVLGAISALTLTARSDGPAPFGMVPAIRLGVVTPILMAVVFAIWWGVRPLVRELLITLACIVAPASLIFGFLMTGGSNMATNRGALTIILLFITVVVRLRFWYAAAACTVILALQFSVPLILNVSLPGSGMLALITLACTLTANYTLEREYRLNYLQRLHSRLQGAQLKAMVEQLHDLSHQDPLTGLANRRAMDELLDDLCAREERFAVILVDIDGFKAFNDTYGHQVGDDCLRRVAAMLRASLRFTDDRIARMGGEEFAVVLPDTELADARLMAERMRRSIYELFIPHKNSPTGKVVTISAGVSASCGQKSSTDVVAEADKALYRAKMSGRNRVELARTDGSDRFTPRFQMAVPA